MIDNIKIEVLQKKATVCTALLTKNHVRRPRNSSNQKQFESSVGSLSQIPTGTHIKIISLVSQVATVQHGDHADTHQRQWNMDIVAETRKMIKTAHRKMLRLIVQTKRHNKTLEKGRAKDKPMENGEKQKRK